MLKRLAPISNPNFKNQFNWICFSFLDNFGQLGNFFLVWSRIISKLNKHLPSVKVNLNSSFGFSRGVYVETSDLFQLTWELPHFAEFLFVVLLVVSWVCGHINSWNRTKGRIQINLYTWYVLVEFVNSYSSVACPFT